MIRWLCPLIVAVLFLARCVEMTVRKGHVEGVVFRRWTWWAMLIGGSSVVMGALTEYFVRAPVFNPALTAIGITVGISSFVLRDQAARGLGRYWSMHIEIRKDHPLVQTGPYAWVRHPIYTAAILEVVGAITTLQAWWSCILFAFLFLPALLLRIRLEETAMISQFGDKYLKYIDSTAMLFPFRLPK